MNILILRPPDDSSEKWDAANALEDGWTSEKAEKFIEENKFSPDEFLEWAAPLVQSEKKEFEKSKKSANQGISQLKLPNGGNDDGPKQSQILIDLASDAQIFHTPGMEAFASFEVKGHRENWPILSRPFKFFLIGQFLKQEGKPPSAQAMKEALGALEAKAWFEGEEVDVSLRLGEHEGKIYLDLCNENWEVIEIDKLGWTITNHSPIKFRRARGMLPLPCPIKGGSLNDLRRFINVPDDKHFRLVIAWLLGALQAKGPFPLLCLQGEQGSAKSTLARILRSLIDPSVSPLRTTPKDARDLAIAANNGRLICFDNLSGLRDWLSDSLCRLATGGGFSTRELYANSDEIIFDAMRPCMLNGIEEVATRNDLIDRAIVIKLPPVPPDSRRTEKSLMKEFEEHRPYILGALLDAVSEALKNISEVKLKSLPRMADFAEWVVAAEPTLPWEGGEFLEAYEGNRAEAVEVSLDSDPVAAAILKLVDQEGEWEGTSTELLVMLEGLIKDSILKTRFWPKDSRSLSGRVDRAAPFLREVGITIEKSRKSGRRLISIGKTKNFCVTTVTSVIPQPETQPGQGIPAVSDGGDDDANAKRMTQMTSLASRLNPLPGGLYDGNDANDARIADSLEMEELDAWEE
jgi:hypothetical protein